MDASTARKTKKSWSKQECLPNIGAKALPHET